jgi:uncharacterized membrane protein YphA (DoxX/SURF4 family)
MRHTISGLLRSSLVRFAIRLVFGGVFIYAGLVKVVAPKEFAKIVVNYHILPENMAVYFAYILPWVELMFGVLLILGLGVKRVALALSCLLVVFASAVLIKYLNGFGSACGCLSLKSSGSESVFLILLRDAGLLACGVFLSFYQNKRAPQ